jgi:hypothetical protein
MTIYCVASQQLIVLMRCPTFTVPHILVNCPRYSETRSVYHIHGTLADMLSDDRNSVSNVLSFSNAVRLAMDTQWARAQIVMQC